jgi:type II secretion system protein H
MVRRSRHHAFTLLELVLVLLIVSIALATAAPSLRGWNRGSKLRDAGEQFLAVARYARTQSAADGRVYRINIDANSGSYVLTAQDGQQFVTLGTEFGRVYSVPDGFRLAVSGSQPNSRVDAIDFYPTGRTQPARIQIAADEYDLITIESPSPSEGFRLVSNQEAAQ